MNWNRVMKRLDEDLVVKNVLLLGDDDATIRRAVLHRFPHAEFSVVAVEADTVGIVAKTIFDLVVVNATTKAYDERTWIRVCDQCAPHLDRMAYLVAPNDGSQPELPAVLYKRFSRQPRKRFDRRDVVLYRPHGAGTIGDALPAGYSVFHACKENIARESRSSPRFSVVGQEGVWGSRWYYGPFWFEKYYGDTEPVIDKGGPLRFVMWQTVARVDTPKGWRRSSLTNHFKQTGFETIQTDAPYESRWSSHARRYRAKWLKQKEKGEWEVFEPSVADFIAAYRRAKMDPVLKFLFIDLVKAKAKTQSESLHLFAIRRKPGSPIEAGFACVDIPEIGQSKHFVSFICESAKKDPVGVGLMDEWHRYAIAKGFRFLDFGVFWAPGDPRDWRGFSKFKGQFDIWFIRYPFPLVRVAGSIWNIMKHGS